MKGRSLTLYVKSTKKAIGIEETGAWGYMGAPGMRGGTRIIRDYKVQRRIQYEYFLAEEQRRALNIIEILAREYGFELTIVDVAKHGSTRRLIEKRVKQMKVFPVLILDSGERVEGLMTRDSLRAFMSRNCTGKFL